MKKISFTLIFISTCFLLPGIAQSNDKLLILEVMGRDVLQNTLKIEITTKGTMSCYGDNTKGLKKSIQLEQKQIVKINQLINKLNRNVGKTFIRMCRGGSFIRLIIQSKKIKIECTCCDWSIDETYENLIQFIWGLISKCCNSES